jgi:subtilisin family serine protease
VEPAYLQRGFWVYGLQPSYGYDASAAELLADPAIHRVVPIYITPADSAEFKVSDLIDVQFDLDLSRDAALALLTSHGLRFVDSSEYRHSLWTCALDDTVTASPLAYGNAMHILPGVKWACARQYASPVLAGVTVPTDPYYQYQYYLKNTGQNMGVPGIDIAAEQAWQVPLTDSSILVAVIDDGVTSHPDLPASRIVPGYDFAGDSLIRCPGCPPLPPDDDPTPGMYKNHGMACAGILAASHNGVGIAGVCGGCRILPVKIFDNAGNRADTIPVADAIRWARDHEARVISCSWVYPRTTPIVPIANAIRDVVDPCPGCLAKGALPPMGAVVVFAAGNDVSRYGGAVQFPANMPEVIAVGAVRNDGTKWDYSPYGSALDVVAPSGDIALRGDQWTVDQAGNLGWNPFVTAGYGDISDQSYTKRMGGTSGACPQVAGIAALLLARGHDDIDPYRPYLKIREIITSTATQDMVSPPVWNPYYGYGRANAYRAMLSIIRGDVNNDGVYDVQDVVMEIDIAFSGGSAVLDDAVGDVDIVNSPGVVEVMDVIYLVAYVFGGGPPPPICYY